MASLSYDVHRGIQRTPACARLSYGNPLWSDFPGSFAARAAVQERRIADTLKALHARMEPGSAASAALKAEFDKLTAEQLELVHKIATIQTQAHAAAQLVYQRQRRRMPEEVSKARTALSALKKRIVTQWSVDEPLHDVSAAHAVTDIHESDDSDTVARKRTQLRRQLASGLAQELYAEVDSDEELNQLWGGATVTDERMNERYALKCRHEELRRELQETLAEEGNKSKMMTLDWKWKIVHAMYEAQVRFPRYRAAIAAERASPESSEPLPQRGFSEMCVVGCATRL